MNSDPFDIVIADFDGDGKADMATDTIGGPDPFRWTRWGWSMQPAL
jgi:hypothetical protein